MNSEDKGKLIAANQRTANNCTRWLKTENRPGVRDILIVKRNDALMQNHMLAMPTKRGV